LPAIETKVARLYNGVDLTMFHASTNPPPAARILAVGRLVEKKGFPVLVDACAHLRARGLAFTCDVVGAGPQEDVLRRAIDAAGLGDRIVLRGPLALEAIAETMREATTVVLPCIRALDGNVDALPTVLLEAMASGVPVISTRLSGIPEIIADGETGYLVTPGDAAELADTLARLLTDPERVRRMGRAARVRAEHLFDLRTNVATLRGWLAAGDDPAPTGHP